MRGRTMRLAGLLLAVGMGLTSGARAQGQPRGATLRFEELPEPGNTPAHRALFAPAPPPVLGQSPFPVPLATDPTTALPRAADPFEALPPRLVRGQDYSLPDTTYPLPLYSNNPAAGGLYLTGEFVMYRQTNPLRHQILAYRGFKDIDGSFGPPGGNVGTFAPALDAKDAGGPGSYQPGFKVGIGWKFEDGTALEVNWMHLLNNTYSHVVTFIPKNFQTGFLLEDSFLFAPVFNFPNDYAGTFNDVLNPFSGTGTQAYGIWNAADIMTIQLTQRVESVEAVYRVPIYENEDWRSYGLVGPRFFWIWENFKWRTTDLDLNGQGAPDNVAIYTNIVSNRMYGAFIGWGNECYLGHGFALSLDLEAALLLDIVKERAKYELGTKDAGPQSKRGITDYTVVPELSANLNLWWYPIEGVQMRLGYDLMAFFNTVAAKQPVDFDYGSVAPPWVRTTRWFDGFNVGIGLIF